ncbi:MAG: hypothetical protein ACTIJ9_16785 [Aequorivita sp.]
MKHLIYIILIALNFNSCKAQKTTHIMNQIIIPVVTKEFETFDINTFNKEVDKLSGKRVILKEKVYIEEDFQDPGYSKVIYDSSSPFYIMKLYFESGNIKEKGIYFNNGSEYGIWYEFNEEGQMVQEIDTDKGYNYLWKDIINYSEEHNFVLTKGKLKGGGIPTEIYKTELEDKKVWQITYYDKKAEKIFQIILDGKDGALLNKKEVKLIGG